MEITVKELIAELKKEPQNNIVSFGGLNLYKLDNKGNITHFEFSQSVYRDSKGVLHVKEHQSSEE